MDHKDTGDLSGGAAAAGGAHPAAATSLSSVALAVLAGIGIVLLLRFARTVFLPLAIGVFISYALEPMVSWLKKCSIPRSIGAGVLLAALVGGAGFGIFALFDDAVAVVEKLPAAARKLGESVRVIRGDGEGLMQKVQRAATELENTTTEAVGPDAVRRGVTRVQVEEKPINVGDYLWQGGSEIVALGSEIILVLFLVYFLLITGDLFKRKFLKLSGASGLGRKMTAELLDQIDSQIARYMLVQVLTSTLVGVVSGIVFWWIGLEQAPIWGIAMGLLDTIPYFGPAIAMAGLFTIGFLQFGTIEMGLVLAGVACVIMNLEGFLLTPWLTMRAVRMNGVALFLGLMFWGWLWGVGGLLLAVPMMVLIKSVCDRVEDLKPVGELLGT